jgi:hypothetical protein
MTDGNPFESAEEKPVTPEQIKTELAEFQKLHKYSDRKKYWQEHAAIKHIVSEINFHA